MDFNFVYNNNDNLWVIILDDEFKFTRYVSEFV